MFGQLVGNRVQRAIAMVCLIAYLPGCTGWHNVPTTQPMPIAERPQDLKLVLRDGQRLELRKARIVGDSVIGESARSSKPIRTAVAVRDIQLLADRRINAGNTVGAIIGITGLAAIVALVAISSSLESSMQCLPFGCP